MKPDEFIWQINGRTKRKLKLEEIEKCYNEGEIGLTDRITCFMKLYDNVETFTLEDFIRVYGADAPFQQVPIDYSNEPEISVQFSSSDSSSDDEALPVTERPLRKKSIVVDESKNEVFQYEPYSWELESNASSSVASTSNTSHMSNSTDDTRNLLEVIELPLFSLKYQSKNDLITGLSVKFQMDKLRETAPLPFNPEIKCFDNLQRTEKHYVLCRLCQYEPYNSKALVEHLFSATHQLKLIKQHVSLSAFDFWRERFVACREEMGGPEIVVKLGPPTQRLATSARNQAITFKRIPLLQLDKTAERTGFKCNIFNLIKKFSDVDRIDFGSDHSFFSFFLANLNLSSDMIACEYCSYYPLINNNSLSIAEHILSDNHAKSLMNQEANVVKKDYEFWCNVLRDSKIMDQAEDTSSDDVLIVTVDQTPVKENVTRTNNGVNEKPPNSKLLARIPVPLMSNRRNTNRVSDLQSEKYINQLELAFTNVNRRKMNNLLERYKLKIQKHSCEYGCGEMKSLDAFSILEHILSPLHRAKLLEYRFESLEFNFWHNILTNCQKQLAVTSDDDTSSIAGSVSSYSSSSDLKQPSIRRNVPSIPLIDYPLEQNLLLSKSKCADYIQELCQLWKAVDVKNFKPNGLDIYRINPQGTCYACQLPERCFNDSVSLATHVFDTKHMGKLKEMQFTEASYLLWKNALKKSLNGNNEPLKTEKKSAVKTNIPRVPLLDAPKIGLSLIDGELFNRRLDMLASAFNKEVEARSERRTSRVSWTCSICNSDKPRILQSRTSALRHILSSSHRALLKSSTEADIVYWESFVKTSIESYEADQKKANENSSSTPILPAGTRKNYPYVALLEQPQNMGAVFADGVNSSRIKKLMNIVEKVPLQLFESDGKVKNNLNVECCICVKTKFTFKSLPTAAKHIFSQAHLEQITFPIQETDLKFWEDNLKPALLKYEKEENRRRLEKSNSPEVPNYPRIAILDPPADDSLKVAENPLEKYEDLRRKYEAMDTESASMKLTSRTMYCNICFLADGFNTPLYSFKDVADHIFTMDQNNTNKHVTNIQSVFYEEDIEYWNRQFQIIAKEVTDQFLKRNKNHVHLLDLPKKDAELVTDECEIDEEFDSMRSAYIMNRYSCEIPEGAVYRCYMCFGKNAYKIDTYKMLISHLLRHRHQANLKKHGVSREDLEFWKEKLGNKINANFQEEKLKSMNKRMMFPISLMYANKDHVALEYQKKRFLNRWQFEQMYEKFRELRKTITVPDFNLRFRTLLKMHDMQTCFWCNCGTFYSSHHILEHVLTKEHQEEVWLKSNPTMDDFTEWFERILIVQELAEDTETSNRIKLEKRELMSREQREADEKREREHQAGIQRALERSIKFEEERAKKREEAERREIEKEKKMAVERARKMEFNHMYQPQTVSTTSNISQPIVQARTGVVTTVIRSSPENNEPATPVIQTIRSDNQTRSNVSRVSENFPGQSTYTISRPPCTRPLFIQQPRRGTICVGPSISQITFLSGNKLQVDSSPLCSDIDYGCAVCNVDLRGFTVWQYVRHAFSVTHLRNLRKLGVQLYKEDFVFWMSMLRQYRFLNPPNEALDLNRDFEARLDTSTNIVLPMFVTKSVPTLPNLTNIAPGADVKNLIAKLDVAKFDENYSGLGFFRRPIGCYFCDEWLATASDVAKHAVSYSHIVKINSAKIRFTEEDIKWWTSKMELCQIKEESTGCSLM